MTVVSFAQVVNRYIFSKGFPWAEEMALYCMIWLIFLGATLCVRRDRHTRIDFLLLLLPYKIRKYVEVFNYLVCIAFLCCLTYFMQPLIRGSMMAKSIGMRVPLNVLYFSVPVGSFLMVIYMFLMIYLKIRETDPALAQQEPNGGNQ